jgi:hypothetical protein
MNNETRARGAGHETAATKQQSAPILATAADVVPWSEVLEHIDRAFGCGYDLGYAHGRNDRLEDDDHARRHDLAYRTIGLRPQNGPPLWAVAS